MECVTSFLWDSSPRLIPHIFFNLFCSAKSTDSGEEMWRNVNLQGSALLAQLLNAHNQSQALLSSFGRRIIIIVIITNNFFLSNLLATTFERSFNAIFLWTWFHVCFPDMMVIIKICCKYIYLSMYMLNVQSFFQGVYFSLNVIFEGRTDTLVLRRTSLLVPTLVNNFIIKIAAVSAFLCLVGRWPHFPSSTCSSTEWL